MLSDQEHKIQTLAALRKAVNEALERKRKLGQYAVVWRDGRPQRIQPGESNINYGNTRSASPGELEVRERDENE